VIVEKVLLLFFLWLFLFIHSDGRKSTKKRRVLMPVDEDFLFQTLLPYRTEWLRDARRPVQRVYEEDFNIFPEI